MLRVVAELIEALDHERLRYCHWKSNDRLTDAVAGITDLDLLFDDKAHGEVTALLRDRGFVKCTAAWFRRYPKIEDFCSIDDETGRLVHVHAHFQLVVGERTIKPYRLPWEGPVLESAITDQRVAIRRLAPEWEMLLLLTRMALKNSRQNRVLRPKAPAAADRREFAFLSSSIDTATFSGLAHEHVGPSSAKALDAVLDDFSNPAVLGRMYTAVINDLRGCRRFGPLREACARSARTMASKVSKVLVRFGMTGITRRRRVVGPGVIVAIMGSDGSGKSTLLGGLDHALGKKLDTLAIYMGSGDGPGSLLRSPMDMLKKLSKKRTRPSNSSAGSRSKAIVRDSSSLVRLGGFIWSLTLALEKRGKLARARRARNAGALVICDRYPQAHSAGVNDGPRLQRFRTHRSYLLRRLAAWELAAYDVDSIHAPDLVIKLVTDIDVLQNRRPEMSSDALQMKQQGIIGLPKYPGSQTQVIDAGQPREIVLAKAMTLIWSTLVSSSR